jgi:hypothetical protein
MPVMPKTADEEKAERVAEQQAMLGAFKMLAAKPQLTAEDNA